jgi:hypothetical protein
MVVLGLQIVWTKKIEVIELEEKELEDEEEVDRVLHQNICGEIMEEVMDVGGDDFIIPPSHVAKNRARKKGGRTAVRKVNK